ncbi:Fanconi anemia core complex-associated protein 20 isoform X3 [Ambystoma mexicanum]
MLPGRSEPAIHRQTGNKAEESTEHVLKISKKAKSEMPRHPKSKNPTLNSQKKGNVKNIADVHGPQQHAASQNLRKAAGFERLFKTSSQSERNETEGQTSREKQNDPSAVDEKISYVEVAHCVPNIPTEKVNEGMAPLQTCPMCLLQFDQKFSPLDIDSHLAKCLSESTEDIVW